MKTKHTWRRIVSFVVAFVMTLGMIVPLTTVEAGAEYVWAPSSMITCHSAFKAAKTVSYVIKGIGAITYATENNQGGVGDWAKLALAYFSGNADENEQIADLKKTMIDQFTATQDAIESLRTDIADLRRDMNQKLGQIDNTVECAYLKSALNQFYSEFFVSAYGELETAYLNIITTLNDPDANEATIRAKMDDLYMKAYKMKNLQDYITGEIHFENESILDLYYEYILRTSNVGTDDEAGYQKVIEQCQDFTLRLFAADTFQKYCLAYASSYQLNYVYENQEAMTAQGSFIGYTLDGTLDGSSNKLTIQEIKRNIAQIDTRTATVSASVAANLSKIYLLHTYIGYSEDGCQYFAPVWNNNASVYSGATYQMFALPSELANLFNDDFSFVTSDENVVDLSDTGRMTITGDTGSTFTVSCVYGKNRLDQPLTVYTIAFKITDRKWAGGYGTAEAPYLIASIAHMKDFATDTSYWNSDVYVKLINDLEMSGQTFPQISDYKGNFDGDNHAIKNLSSPSGLFGSNSGEIKNLVLDGMNISNSTYGVANIGCVANSNNGVISNCHVRNSNIAVYRHNFTGSTGYSSFYVLTGGIAGTGNSGSLIEYCSITNSKLSSRASTRELYDAGNLFDNDDMTSYVVIRTGGIVGAATNVTVNNCYVGTTTISTETFAKYYKWSFLWSHTYNRVDARVYTGIIAGDNSGTFNTNYYFDSNNNSNPINKIAASKEDSGFVSSSVTNGVQGIASSSARSIAPISSIQIKSLPYQTVYKSGETINASGLTVVGDNQAPIYGYTMTSDNTNADGKKVVVVAYQGLSTSFTVDVACQHKNIQYVPSTTVDCTSGGYAAGIFCNDCQVYIDGHEYISQGACYDSDKNHICDSCGGPMGEHVAIDGDHSHICGYCGQPVTACRDADQDHLCDICGTFLAEHKASDGFHTCGYCGKAITECTDSDKDHACDICGESMGSHVANSEKHICDYCGMRVTDCVDTDRNHACDICSVSMGIHTVATGKHICNYCGMQMTECVDMDMNHACDTCGTLVGDHVEIVGGHNCGYCGGRVSNCVDADKNHMCDVCGVPMGNHAATGNSHTCDYCNLQVTDCADFDKDHACDVCGATLGNHVPANNRHTCDYCGVVMTDCVDSDMNHGCDVCGAWIGNHAASVGKHTCDYCGMQMTVCDDENEDDLCDICGKQLSSLPAVNPDQDTGFQQPADVGGNDGMDIEESSDQASDQLGCRGSINNFGIAIVVIAFAVFGVLIRRKEHD